MRKLIILLVLLLCSCAFNVKESYRNPDFKQRIDKISTKWEPLDKYNVTTYTTGSRYSATEEVGPHIADVGKRYPALLAKELLYYDTDLVNDADANYRLHATTKDQVTVSCKSYGQCTPTVTFFFTLKEKITDLAVWSAAISVQKSPPPYWSTKNSDGKTTLITPDATQELVETMVREWDKYDLLSSRTALPRKAPSGDITSMAVATKPVKGQDDNKINTSSTNNVDTAANPANIGTDDAEAQRIINWIRQNNKWGSEGSIVKSVQNDINSLTNTLQATWEIGWGLTKSGMAYRLNWSKNKLDIAELTPDDATKKGFKENSIRFRPRKN